MYDIKFCGLINSHEVTKILTEAIEKDTGKKVATIKYNLRVQEYDRTNERFPIFDGVEVTFSD